jgi:NTP pyrophosphatase (non-canonical NTP hydrolase)
LGGTVCSATLFILDRRAVVTKKEIYTQALVKWGRTFQMDMLVEECAELIKAVQKLNHRHGDVLDVVEELADVEIMCEQMRLIFNPVKIDEMKTEKLARLERILCR